MLIILTVICGCGSGGGSTQNVVDSDSASLTIKAGGDGSYTVWGDVMDGVVGIDVTINYDSSSFSSPSVSQGSLVSEALFASNPSFSANTIKIAIISTETFTGSGPIATITFANGSGSTPTIATVILIDSKGVPISPNVGSDNI